MYIGLSTVFQNSVIEKVSTSINNVKTQNLQNATITRKESELILQQAQAKINVILSEAENIGRVLIQEAKTEGFINVQNATIKGLEYIKEKLELNEEQLLKYSWLRDLNNVIKDKTARIVAGFSDSDLKDLISAK